MEESNNSHFENVLLKNIDQEIPINVDLSDRPERISASTMRIWTISHKQESLSIRFKTRQ